MNYDFSQKNHWRNRIWNNISERISCRPKDAIIVYLAAEQDLDRRTALIKGFSENNLIAVDREREVVNKLRKDGALAVCGDVFDVLRNWPAKQEISSVLLDFTCGLEESVMNGLFNIMKYPSFINCVFMVNVQRGRDSSSNHMRKDLADKWYDGKQQKRNRLLYDFAFYQNHRWEMQLMFGIDGFRYPSPAELKDKFKEQRWIDIFNHNVVRQKWERQRAILDSYRSVSGIYFDWVLFKNVTLWDRIYNPPESLNKDNQSVASSISAVLAHRTRRLAA